MKKTRAYVAAAVLCGYLAGNMLPLAQAEAGSVLEDLGKAVKTGGIVYLVDRYGSELNTFINKLTSKYPISDEYATKVVPIIAVGTKGYVGAAQISGPRSKVDQVKGALSLEGEFLNRTFRIQALIPVDSLDPTNCTRIQGVGVSAKIDVAI
ncbi:MAG: hypothetical protein ACOYKB_05185 [Succiniclasticum sp.]|jgi:hypothetical protein